MRQAAADFARRVALEQVVGLEVRADERAHADVVDCRDELDVLEDAAKGRLAQQRQSRMAACRAAHRDHLRTSPARLGVCVFLHSHRTHSIYPTKACPGLGIKWILGQGRLNAESLAAEHLKVGGERWAESFEIETSIIGMRCDCVADRTVQEGKMVIRVS
eukprot:1256350-Pleurochrysis_carterae.AAC.1